MNEGKRIEKTEKSALGSVCVEKVQCHFKVLKVNVVNRKYLKICFIRTQILCPLEKKFEILKIKRTSKIWKM